MLIEVPMEGPFPEFIEFFNESIVLVRQQVTFEWVPCKCFRCHMLGHNVEVCRKKGNIRREWRRVNHTAPVPAVTPPVTPVVS